MASVEGLLNRLSEQDIGEWKKTAQDEEAFARFVVHRLRPERVVKAFLPNEVMWLWGKLSYGDQPRPTLAESLLREYCAQQSLQYRLANLAVQGSYHLNRGIDFPYLAVRNADMLHHLPPVSRDAPAVALLRQGFPAIGETKITFWPASLHTLLVLSIEDTSRKEEPVNQLISYAERVASKFCYAKVAILGNNGKPAPALHARTARRLDFALGRDGNWYKNLTYT